MTSAVEATYTYADGTSLTVIVQVPESYPDALNQARLEAVRGIEQMMDQLDQYADDDED